MQADGKILVGGAFDFIAGQNRFGIARLNANGTLDTVFHPNAGGIVRTVEVQADGGVLAGGDSGLMIRLDGTTGARDSSFNPSPQGGGFGGVPHVFSIAMQPDGKILAGGHFSTIGGQIRNNIARLNTDGTADPAFNSDVHGGDSAAIAVYTIALQADGKVLVGGSFIRIGALTRNCIARLDPATGAADNSFDPNASALVFSIAVQADGKILAGGRFFSIGGQTRYNFARLSNDTAALQNLAVSQTTATWTRGGSSPQFARVAFESSTDNLNYTPLGNGTASGSNWTLTGLNLPSGQNLYIRARGHYRGGYANGSESIQESVRNAFIAPPPPRLNIQRSANTNVVLSWTTNFTGFTLESNTNLNTNVWSVVAPAPVVSGTNNVVTNAVTGSARFYRLRQ